MPSPLVTKTILLVACLLGISIPATAQVSIVNRNLEQLEQERERKILKHELDTMRETRSPSQEQPATRTKLPTGNFQFVLKKVSYSPSKVLMDEEIARVTAPWINKIIGAPELGQLIEAINQLYREKGYAVCQAALRPQRIRNGNLTITLIEGKTDTVTVNNLNHTKDSYVLRAFDMPVGKVANYRDMYERLVRFNMTNDIHLSIDIQAGERPETTRYEIYAQEPNNWTASIFADTLGTDSSGRYRAGASISNRSVFGYRDSLYLIGIATEGSKSVLGGYSVPLNSFGTRLIANLSAGDVDIIEGPNEPFDVSEQSFTASLRLEHPFAITETSKQIAFTEYSYKSSETDMYSDMTIAKSQIDTVSVGLDSLMLGNQWSMYLNNRFSYHKAREKLFGNQYNYWIYSGDWFGQALLNQQFSLNASASWQAKFTGDEVVSDDQFYLGNSAGVRGYPNDVLSADNGFWINIEAQYRWIDSFNTFVFFDAGHLSGVSSYDKRGLYSTGIGLNWNPCEWAQVKATMGVPLTRQVTVFEKVDSVRFDATLTITY